jgi:hypothetical protein
LTVTWDLWIPDAASRGISFARAAAAFSERVFVHAAPTVLRVEVSDDQGRRIAFGDQLRRESDSPMTLLTVHNQEVTRVEMWPHDGDLGTLVILPGGEAGTLTAWWHAPDHSEWRWSVEFHNRR